MKAGSLTSEFWVTVLTIAAVAFLMYNGRVEETRGLQVIGGLVAWWTGNRTWAKVRANGNNNTT